MDVIPKIIVQNDTDTVADMNNFKVIFDFSAKILSGSKYALPSMHWISALTPQVRMAN